MIFKGFAVAAIFLVVPHAQLPVRAQAANHPALAEPASSAVAQPAASTPANSAARTDCQSGPCDDQPPHITIATPAPAPAPWLLQDRIAWGVNVLLALLGYAGIMMALSLLKKIERQTKYVETAATAARETAEAALLNTQAILHAERPWVLITVAPSPSLENGFTLIATNLWR